VTLKMLAEHLTNLAKTSPNANVYFENAQDHLQPVLMLHRREAVDAKTGLTYYVVLG
jgi:hypothetical protein